MNLFTILSSLNYRPFAPFVHVKKLPIRPLLLLLLLQEDVRRKQQEALQTLLKGEDAERVARLMAQYGNEADNWRRHLEDGKASQREALLAKMAARQRMRAELEREGAVRAEVERVAKEQVRGSGGRGGGTGGREVERVLKQGRGWGS